MTKVTMTVPAEEVQEGDFLPGLDNGYVFEAPEPAEDHMSWKAGYQAGAVSEHLVIVSFHTADGDEAYLVVPADMPVTVEREQ